MNPYDRAERTIEAWIAEGPLDLPDATARAITVATRTTPQRQPVMRRPWRNPAMTSITRLMAGAAVLAIVAVAAVQLIPRSDPAPVGGPGPSPSRSATPSASEIPEATPSPMPAPEAFRSTRYGYGFEKPANWRVAEATADWEHGQAIHPGLDALDRFIVNDPVPAGQPAGVTHFVGVASQDIAPDDGDVAWLRGYRARFQEANGVDCAPVAPDAWAPIDVAGTSGLGLQTTCAGAEITEVIAVRGGRGWVVIGEAGYVEELLVTFRYPVE